MSKWETDWWSFRNCPKLKLNQKLTTNIWIQYLEYDNDEIKRI